MRLHKNLHTFARLRALKYQIYFNLNLSFRTHLDLLLGEQRRLCGDARGGGQRGRRPEHEVAGLLRQVHVRRPNLRRGEGRKLF